MKKIINFCFLIYFLLCGNPFCMAQGKFVFDKQVAAKNIAYGELGGKGGLYSINYERCFFSNKGKVNTSIAIGYTSNYKSTSYGSTSHYSIITRHSIFPFIQLNLFVRDIEKSKNFYGDFGMSFALSREIGINNNLGEYFFHIDPSIGIRYQRANGGLFAKFYLIASLSLEGIYRIRDTFHEFSNKLPLWPGLSVGYSFGRK